MNSEQKEFEAPTVNGSPEEIWLVYGDIYEDADHEECDDVSWCSDQQFDSDVKYIRADIIEQQAAELAALRAFAKDLFIDVMGCDGNSFIDEMLVKHRLIDESGNPTKLLTGE